jgi:hypothetical protein
VAPEQETPLDEDPLLALRGLGKELWKELGGGEKFIREMRDNWYGKRLAAGLDAGILK